MEFVHPRRKTRQVTVGNLKLGGDSRILVQSMLNAPVSDFEANIKQAKALRSAGCDIIRVAISSVSDVDLVYALKEAVDIPLVADIHFDYKVALACIDAGIDKIRINPGHIGKRENVEIVADACRSKNIPIRIGVN